METFDLALLLQQKLKGSLSLPIGYSSPLPFQLLPRVDSQFHIQEFTTFPIKTLFCYQTQKIVWGMWQLWLRLYAPRPSSSERMGSTTTSHLSKTCQTWSWRQTSQRWGSLTNLLGDEASSIISRLMFRSLF